MIDFHCHILPDMDDGSPSMDESLEMARQLALMGFSAILATPHLMEDYFVWQEDILEEKVEQLNAACRQAELPVTVYPGAELLLSPWVLDLLSAGKLPTLNKSSYLLFEIPLTQPLTEFCEELFFRLRTQGYELVLAHPERCLTFQEEPRKLLDLRKYELLYQLNLSSLTGHFGENSRKLAIDLLKQNLITFIGSDAHHSGEGRMGDIPSALEILRRYAGKDGMDLLLEKNPLKALNNERINVEFISPEKDGEKPGHKVSLLDKIFKRRRR